MSGRRGRKPAIDWRDRPCWRCGYPLRNLPGGEVRNCPECGLAIRVSLSNNPSLAIADPAWLARQWAACVAVAIATVLAAAGSTVGLLSVGSPVFRACLGVATALTVASTAALICGWLVLASADRNHPPTRTAIGWRIGRWIVAAVLLSLAGFALFTSLGGGSITVTVFMLLPWSFLWLFVLASALWRAARLMRRSQHRRLRQILPVLAWGCYVVAIAPYLNGWIAVLLSQWRRGATLWTAAGGIAIAATVTTIAWVCVATQVAADRRTAIDAWISD